MNAKKIEWQIEHNEYRIVCLKDEICERKSLIRSELDETNINGDKIASLARYIDECQVMINMLNEENQMLKTLL